MAEWGELKDMPPDRGGKPSPKQVNCFRCAHFKVTWNPKSPKGCLLFGFSGTETPSETVIKTTGRKCPGFEEKKRPASSR